MGAGARYCGMDSRGQRLFSLFWQRYDWSSLGRDVLWRESAADQELQILSFDHQQSDASVLPQLRTEVAEDLMMRRKSVAAIRRCLN